MAWQLGITVYLYFFRADIDHNHEASALAINTTRVHWHMENQNFVLEIVNHGVKI